MIGFSATVRLVMVSSQDNAEHVVDTLTQVHPATFTGANGNLGVIITLHAETLAQAAEELHLSRPAARARIGRDLIGTKVGDSGSVIPHDRITQAINHTTH